MSFFDNPNSMEVKVMSEENEDINEALEQLRRLSSNKKLREIIEREERIERDRRAELQFAIEEGLEQGIERGEKKKQLELIKNMIKENLPIELISKITGISQKEISELIKNET